MFKRAGAPDATGDPRILLFDAADLDSQRFKALDRSTIWHLARPEIGVPVRIDEALPPGILSRLDLPGASRRAASSSWCRLRSYNLASAISWRNSSDSLRR
jgi:hypothetical protein